jgi:hypothetical protein
VSSGYLSLPAVMPGPRPARDYRRPLCPRSRDVRARLAICLPPPPPGGPPPAAHAAPRRRTPPPRPAHAGSPHAYQPRLASEKPGHWAANARSAQPAMQPHAAAPPQAAHQAPSGPRRLRAIPLLLHPCADSAKALPDHLPAAFPGTGSFIYMKYRNWYGAGAKFRHALPPSTSSGLNSVVLCTITRRGERPAWRRR